MNLEFEVVKEIEKNCGKCSRISGLGWHFMFNERHMFYLPKKDDPMIRFSIPHLVDTRDFEKQLIIEAINDTNREVKYIKVVILNNNSVSISYDHIATGGEDIPNLITHMIKMLDFASSYMLKKIS